MKPSAYFLAVLLVHAPLAAHSETADTESCTRIENDTQRLACYDRLFRRADISPGAQEEPVAASEQLAERGEDAGFGAEQLPEPPENDHIEARLLGDFTGWSGRTIFRLDNGQVWRQANNRMSNYTPREPILEPKITITKSALGSYKLKVEGIKRIILVKRVE